MMSYTGSATASEDTQMNHDDDTRILPKLVLASGDNTTKVQIIEMFRQLSGREPTPEELAELDEEMKT